MSWPIFDISHHRLMSYLGEHGPEGKERRKAMSARNPSAEHITEQLRAWSGGKNIEASDAVFKLVYDEFGIAAK